MGFANEYFSNLQDAYQAMAATPITFSDAKSYLERCLGIDSTDPECSTRSKNILDTTITRLFDGRGADLPGVRGTVWGAYNAVTEQVDHRKYRSDDVRLENAWFDGAGRATKQKAFDEALALVG